MKQEILKPCPFCGEAAVGRVVNNIAVCRCPDLECIGNFMYWDVSKWNIRAKTITLPSDSEVSAWFDNEYISECSPSVAVYKFRDYLASQSEPSVPVIRGCRNCSHAIDTVLRDACINCKNGSNWHTSDATTQIA